MAESVDTHCIAAIRRFLVLLHLSGPFPVVVALKRWIALVEITDAGSRPFAAVGGMSALIL